MCNRAILSFLMLFAAIALPSSAMACSCAPMTRAQAVAAADVAFSGRVQRLWRSRDGASLLASVAVTGRIKGRVGEVATVRTNAQSNLCGYALERGRRYDFAAERGAGGRLSITMCSMVPMNPSP